jgi:ABC-type Mn2+/Zn2+ transport system permease subunit
MNTIASLVFASVCLGVSIGLIGSIAVLNRLGLWDETVSRLSRRRRQP